MATPNAKLSLGGIVRRLVHDGVLSENVAREAVQGAQREKQSVVGYIVGQNLASGRAVAEAAVREFGLPLIDLDALDLEMIPSGVISGKLLEKHHALPLFKRGNRLYVGISDPTNMVALDEFKFASGLTTEAVLVEENKLAKRIEQALQAQEAGSIAEDLDEDLENLELEEPDEEGGDEPTRADVDDTPVVRYVNKIMVDAINRGASDIHIEPYEKYLRVRYRIDGVLLEVAKPPLAMAPRLIARVKVMSRMDISERRIPQDGRIKMKLSRSRAIDFRVNTCPTLFGEKVVLRILDPGSAQMGIDHLGYEPKQKDLYTEALSKPYGMILVTARRARARRCRSTPA